MKKGTLALAVLLSSIVSISATYLVVKNQKDGGATVVVSESPTATSISNDLEDCCRVSLFRETEGTHRFVHPLLLVEDAHESEKYQPLKEKLESAIEELKKSGDITRASVYWKDQSGVHWIAAGGNELYYPGSMLKVAMMMHILKLSESQPDLLKSLVRLDRLGGGELSVPPSQRLIPGRVYTVTELIEAMIIRSDNDATALLENFIERKEYEAMFMTLGLTPPAEDDYYYQIRPSDYARFFRVLYNASYLSHTNSEYALNLLSKSEFKEGVVKGLPKGASAAHKFGERYTESDLKQFHETALVYAGSRSILLCIMTEGKEFPKLREAVSTLSNVSLEP